MLVPDKNTEFGLRGLLARHSDLGMRAIGFDVFIHPERDPGCLLRGHEFLRQFHRQYSHALLMFDLEGSGQESKSRDQLEREVETRLKQSGWGDRAAAILFDPELEIWVWAESGEVDRILGWAGRSPDLRSWLRGSRLVNRHATKPDRPKEALEEALRTVRKPRSSAIYLELAGAVDHRRCADPAFQKFRSVVSQWFPTSATTVADS